MELRAFPSFWGDRRFSKRIEGLAPPAPGTMVAGAPPEANFLAETPLRMLKFYHIFALGRCLFIFFLYARSKSEGGAWQKSGSWLVTFSHETSRAYDSLALILRFT